jgi:hypothetical protein
MLTVSELEQQFQAIVSASALCTKQPEIGVLTSEHRDLWNRAYQKLVQVQHY